MQIAPETRRRILRYVARRIRMIAHAGYPVASDEASILLTDAITDTLTGAVIWDRRYSLAYHLCSVVRSRTWSQLRRMSRRAHVSLEAIEDADVLFGAESIDGELAPARPDALLGSAEIVCGVCRVIRERAMCDAPLTALLDAYAAGFIKRREVMKLTSLSRAEFVNARRRLDRMLCSVPVELRNAALSIMQRDPGSLHSSLRSLVEAKTNRFTEVAESTA